MGKKPPKPSFQVNNFLCKQIFWGAIDWLFPARCAACGKGGARFCADCIQKSSKVNQAKCVFCGERRPDRTITHQCSRTSFIDGGYAWGLHSGPLRKGLHSLKYRRDLGLAEVFSDILVALFPNNLHQIDIIVPVPLGPKRLKERGYNQAQLLASGCADRLGLDCKPHALVRFRETRSQVGLSIEERQLNVKGAFLANSKEIHGKKVLLVDDVITTGATLNACAEALKQAGALQIFSLTLARAP